MSTEDNEVRLPQQVSSDRGEDVEEEGGEFVQAVEDQAVPPDDDGPHQRPHAEDVVGLK